MELSPRTAARMAAAIASVLPVGLAVGVPAAFADIGGQSSYLCTTKAGNYTAQVRVEAKSPTRVTAGGPITFGRVSLSVLLPEALANEVAPLPGKAAPATAAAGIPDGRVPETERLRGSARLFVTAKQNGQATGAEWPGFEVDATRTGDNRLRLTGTFDVPPLKTAEAGDVIWVANGLTMAFDQSTTGANAPAAVTCVPERAVSIGHVSVTGGTGRQAAGTAQSPSGTPSAAGEFDCFEIPKPGDDPRYDFNPDPVLMDVFKNPGHADPQDESQWKEIPPEQRRGLPVCIRAAGFTNVKKLGNATPVGALTLLRRTANGLSPVRPGNTANYVQQRGYFDTLAAESKATVLSLGFMPTTATTSVRQVAAPGAGPDGLRTGNLRSDIAQNADGPGATRDGVELGDETWARAYVQVLVDDSSVNGTRLDLGKNCRTGPTLLNLNTYTGDFNIGRVRIEQGSTLTGELKIPAFVGCGVGEDLSPILTASISGSGNYVRLASGTWCYSIPDPAKCDTSANEPGTWTVTPAGDVTIEQTPFVLSLDKTPGSEIRCDSLTMKGKLRSGHWQDRFIVGQIRTAESAGCVLTAGAETRTVEMTAETKPWNINIRSVQDGVPSLEFRRVTLKVSDIEGVPNCTLRLGGLDNRGTIGRPGYFGGPYRDGTMTLVSDALFVMPQSECASPPLGFQKLAAGTLSGSPFAFTPKQTFTERELP
ncbi:MAG: hypothetical protein ACRDNL_06380 [Spirillospora sp.]